MKKRTLLQASFTVEAAMLMPVLFVSFFLLVFLSAHVHNRACLYARAAEQAISGHPQEDPSCFALAEVACQREESTSKRIVGYTAGSLYLNGSIWKSIREEAVYKKYQPAKRIRQFRAGKKLLTEESDGRGKVTISDEKTAIMLPDVIE